jgi:hypothetical protein
MVELKSLVFCALAKLFERNFIRSLQSRASVEADFDPSQNNLASQGDLPHEIDGRHNDIMDQVISSRRLP